MVKSTYVNKRREDKEMKTYSKPEINITKIMVENSFLQGGSGVKTGGTVKQEYTSTDVSYGKQSSLWDSNEWDEEE